MFWINFSAWSQQFFLWKFLVMQGFSVEFLSQSSLEIYIIGTNCRLLNVNALNSTKSSNSCWSEHFDRRKRSSLLMQLLTENYVTMTSNRKTPSRTPESESHKGNYDLYITTQQKYIRITKICRFLYLISLAGHCASIIWWFCLTHRFISFKQ